jgi:hypothetical protein
MSVSYQIEGDFFLVFQHLFEGAAVFPFQDVKTYAADGFFQDLREKELRP